METKTEIFLIKRDHQKAIDPGVLLIFAYVIAIIFFFLLGGITRVFAQENNDFHQEISMDEVKQGELLIATGDAALFVRALLIEQKVDLTVSGMIVNALVKQRFKNTSAEWVEAVYVFPLPDESAVKHMRMVVGDRVIEGVIKEKQEARKTYEQAKKEGKKTSLLAQKRPNIFTMAVANIPPHESIEVEIEYLDTVRFDDALFSLRFPLVVGPRYIPGVPMPRQKKNIAFDENGWAFNSDQVEDGSQITPPVVEPGDPPVNQVDLQLTLSPGFPVENLLCLYHGVKINQASNDSYTLTFDGRVFADRDFVVEYRAANNQKISASIFREKFNDENYTYFMLMPPTEKMEITLPRDVIFVLDKSGSMAGTSIRQAKKALEFAISRLSTQDRFNVVVFNNRASSFFVKPLPASSRNTTKALQKISALDAEGGTEMAAALNLALDGRADRGRIRQVVFLTDGAVGNELALFQLINDKLGDNRLFTVGIGSAPNSYFMSRAATMGRGTFTFIGKIDEVSSKMSALFEKLEYPVVTNLSVQVDAEAAVELYPSPIPDLYHGEPVVGVLKSSSPLEHLSLSGMSVGKGWSVEMKFDKSGLSPGISTLWARKKINSLMGDLHQGVAEPEIRKKIIETAVDHHLVSKYTSLVAVEEEISRPSNRDVKSGQVKTNIPQGWQHNKVFGTSARTATRSQTAMVLGCIALLLGMILLRNLPMRRGQ